MNMVLNENIFRIYYWLHLQIEKIIIMSLNRFICKLSFIYMAYSAMFSVVATQHKRTASTIQFSRLKEGVSESYECM